MIVESKYGISLKKYTELEVKTIEAGDDELVSKKIIENNGINYKDWIKAKREWNNKINDPNDEHKSYNDFLSFYDKFLAIYHESLDRHNSGQVPCSLEEFTKIHCTLSAKKSYVYPLKPVKHDRVLNENGFTLSKWDICNSYWIVRLGMPNYRNKFAGLVRKYLH